VVKNKGYVVGQLIFREHMYAMKESVTHNLQVGRHRSPGLVGVPCHATDECYTCSWKRGNYDVTADRPTIY